MQYFLDEMQMYELSIILDLLEYTYKESWEQTRMLSFITAQIQSTKTLKLTDIMKFSWDNDNKEKKDTHVSNEDKQRLIEKMKLIEQNYNK